MDDPDPATLNELAPPSGGLVENFADTVGRLGRLWIILAVVAAISLSGFVLQSVSSRRSNERLSELRADLDSSFRATTSDDFAEYTFSPSDSDSPDILDVLTTIGGVQPDTVQFEGDAILARYVIDVLGGSRCVRASWTSSGVNFENGSGNQCTSIDLR